MNLPLIIFLLMFTLTLLLRIPIAFGMIMSSIFYFTFAAGPAKTIGMTANQFLSNMNVSFILLAVPLFIFAANIMNTGAVTELIFRFANTIVGRWKGGMGHVNVLASLIFSGMTGSAVADASGLGIMEIEAMRYHRRFGDHRSHLSAQHTHDLLQHALRRVRGSAFHGRDGAGGAHGGIPHGVCRVYLKQA